MGFIVMSVKFQDERNRNLRIQGEFNPYQRKPSFMSGNEKKLYSILSSIQGLQNYYIYPQLHLSTILEVKEDARDMQGKFEWLNKLFVDFVICDRENIEPVLVIELNDSTHKWGSRKARDQFIKNALSENGIQLLTFSTNDLAQSTIVESKISEWLN